MIWNEISTFDNKKKKGYLGVFFKVPLAQKKLLLEFDL